MGDRDDTPSPESSSDEDFVMEETKDDYDSEEDDYDSEEDDYDMSEDEDD